MVENSKLRVFQVIKETTRARGAIGGTRRIFLCATLSLCPQPPACFHHTAMGKPTGLRERGDCSKLPLSRA